MHLISGVFARHRESMFIVFPGCCVARRSCCSALHLLTAAKSVHIRLSRSCSFFKNSFSSWQRSSAKSQQPHELKTMHRMVRMRFIPRNLTFLLCGKSPPQGRTSICGWAMLPYSAAGAGASAAGASAAGAASTAGAAKSPGRAGIVGAC